MKLRIVLVTLFLFCCGLATQAQENAGPGPVWRVTFGKVQPGKMSEAMADIRENLKPIFEEAKKQGLIVDYKVFTNITKDGAGDWDIAQAVAFKNWAALDGLGSKMDAIILKHYGTRERQAASDHRRELGEEVSSWLMREVTLTPPPTQQTSQSTAPKQP